MVKLSKEEVKFFSRPESLFVPITLFIFYTCPLAYILINTIVKGCFWTAFKNELWVMFLGGGATLFAFYFVILFFVARKLR